MNSAEVSISGGSDTEASRSRLKDDEKGHTRTSSTVKKPTTFKSVSVNKTFLASKGAAAVGAAKSADKPTPGTSLTSAQGTATPASSRPRLVAKSGGGLVTKAAAGVNGGKSAQAPDPSVVWNKNRRKYIDTRHPAQRLLVSPFFFFFADANFAMKQPSLPQSRRSLPMKN